MSVSNELEVIDRAEAHVVKRKLLTTVGVPPEVRGELTRYDVEALLTYSGALGDMSRWAVADLLVWGEDRAAERAGSRNSRAFWEERDRVWTGMLAVCKMEISQHTAYNMAACAKAWPWGRRRYNNIVSFEHHRILVGREEAEQDYWLDLTEAGEWSVSRLRASLYAGDDPLNPSVVMPKYTDPWPEERIKKFVEASGLEPQWIAIDLINKIRGDYQDVITKGKFYQRQQG